MHSIHKFAKRTTLSLFLRQNGEFFCGSVITPLTKFLKFFIVYAQLFPQAPLVQFPPEPLVFPHPQPGKSLFSRRLFTPVIIRWSKPLRSFNDFLNRSWRDQTTERWVRVWDFRLREVAVEADHCETAEFDLPEPLRVTLAITV